MMPILLLSKNIRKTETYLADLIAEGAFSPSSVFYYRKSPNLITIDQIREIKSLLNNSFVRRALFVLYDFDSAKKETQNAFLKTLEETSTKADFLLVVSDLGPILPTVASRCLIKKLKVKTKSEVDSSPNPAIFHRPLAKLLTDFTLADREKAIKLCDQFLSVFRQGLKTLSYGQTLSAAKIVKEIIKTRSLIMKNNLNAQIGVDHLSIMMKNHFLLTKDGGLGDTGTYEKPRKSISLGFHHS